MSKICAAKTEDVATNNVQTVRENIRSTLGVPQVQKASGGGQGIEAYERCRRY